MIEIEVKEEFTNGVSGGKRYYVWADKDSIIARLIRILNREELEESAAAIEKTLNHV
jgi:hypothetical protein